MHWAYEVAHELIRKHPNKEKFVCASELVRQVLFILGTFVKS